MGPGPGLSALSTHGRCPWPPQPARGRSQAGCSHAWGTVAPGARRSGKPPLRLSGAPSAHGDREESWGAQLWPRPTSVPDRLPWSRRLLLAAFSTAWAEVTAASSPQLLLPSLRPGPPHPGPPESSGAPRPAGATSCPLRAASTSSLAPPFTRPPPCWAPQWEPRGCGLSVQTRCGPRRVLPQPCWPQESGRGGGSVCSARSADPADGHCASGIRNTRGGDTGVKRLPNANATDTHLRPLKVKKNSYCHAPLNRRLQDVTSPSYISF